jgi:UDP-N-acetylmuramoyl-L-alanyl-D-glutamate--2,6-diaminopimelate ligase/murE/murF fusion protein
MKLSGLLKAVNVKSIHNGDPEIRSIHYRAQDVFPDGLFVAIKGFKADGHAFIDEALEKGAVAIVTQKPMQKPVTIVEVDDSRSALSGISNAFYGCPSKNLFVIGITGTNGKTTTAFLIESILAEAGFSVGVIGTMNCRYSGKTFDNPITTPESLDLQRILSEMLNSGVTHVVMEVSSHAVDLFRVEHCFFDIGVFTNLSQDHLDYHKTMVAYWSCKKRLFTELLGSGSVKTRTVAVINGDDEKGKELLGQLTVSSLSTGLENDRMIRPGAVKQNLSGIEGNIITPSGSFEFYSKLVGTYNLENILNASAVGIALELPLDVIKAGIEKVSHVPGRLERVSGDNSRFVYVDYAHTPDALENVLTAIKFLQARNMICVFGCGGDRDKEKRPLMGEIAGRLCDLVIVTSDNPRTESPMEIIDQVRHGIEKTSLHELTSANLIQGFEKRGFVIEPDRGAAIQLGITASQPGDTVLIAGKGHETYQILGDRTIPFDDRLVAKSVLSKL